MANASFSFRKLMAVASDNKQEAAIKINSVSAQKNNSNVNHKGPDVNDAVKRYKERIEKEKRRAEEKKKKERESLLQARIEKHGGVTREIAETFKLPFAQRLSGADAKIDPSAVAAIPGAKPFHVPEDELVGRRKKKYSEPDINSSFHVEEKKAKYEEPVAKSQHIRQHEQKRFHKPVQKPMDFHSLLQIADSVKNDPTPLISSAGVKIDKRKRPDEPTTKYLLSDATAFSESKPKKSSRNGYGGDRGNPQQPSTSAHFASQRCSHDSKSTSSSARNNSCNNSGTDRTTFKIPKGKQVDNRAERTTAHSQHSHQHSSGPHTSHQSTVRDNVSRKAQSMDRNERPVSNNRPTVKSKCEGKMPHNQQSRKIPAEPEPPAFVVVNGVKYYMEGTQQPDSSKKQIKPPSASSVNSANDTFKRLPTERDRAKSGSSSKHSSSSTSSTAKKVVSGPAGVRPVSKSKPVSGISPSHKSSHQAVSPKTYAGKCNNKPVSNQRSPAYDRNPSESSGANSKYGPVAVNGRGPSAPSRPITGPRPPAWASAPGIASMDPRKRAMYKEYYDQYKREEERGYDSVEDESEEDSDMEDFIDDSVQEGQDVKVSDHIKEIFKYDRSKYAHLDDRDDRKMEVGFRQCQKEEARSSRLGAQEDMEEWRKEQEEMERKLARSKRK